MKFGRRREFRKGRIEIIPMIDVMFFLLVTFMLASLSMQALHSVPVDLPRGEAVTLDATHAVTLAVTPDGQIYLDSTPVSLDSLAETLKSMRADPESPVIIAADNAAQAGVVVQAMVQARRTGVERFLFAVKRG